MAPHCPGDCEMPVNQADKYPHSERAWILAAGNEWKQPTKNYTYNKHASNLVCDLVKWYWGKEARSSTDGTWVPWRRRVECDTIKLSDRGKLCWQVILEQKLKERRALTTCLPGCRIIQGKEIAGYKWGTW